MIKWLAMTIPLLLPAVGYWIGLRLGGGRLLAGLLGSGLAGSATGMFFGSVAGAMASAVGSGEALIKGGAIGFAIGVAVGLVLAGLAHLLRIRRVTVLVVLVALAGCASPSPDSGAAPDSAMADSSHAPAGGAAPAGAIEGTGTVRFVDLEGGCWAIDLDAAGGATGERLQPAALAEEFKVDSLRVRLRARPVDAMGFCMLGRIVELESIERIEY
jgi:hypothetical protein